MSQEILYTSARQGLKPGSSGFCTVVATRGMAKNLIERLETLCGYRHAYAVHDKNADKNPVNYSHVTVTVGRQRFHVLSRIGDAGQDYSNRSNNLAHIVALEPAELAPGGPAWALASPGFCTEKWGGQPGHVEPNLRKPPQGSPPFEVCRTWDKLTKDAGWAGYLAQSALAPGGRPQTVIFPPGADTLSLVVEALNLIPEEKRWNVSFSTYFTKLAAGVECQWRFLLDGTLEATAARKNQSAPAIDLCNKKIGNAPAGPLVNAARNGTKPDWSQYKTAAPPIPPPQTAPASSRKLPGAVSTEEIVELEEVVPSGSTAAPPAPPPTPRSAGSDAPLFAPAPPSLKTRKSTGAQPWIYWLTGGVLLSALMIALVIVVPKLLAPAPPPDDTAVAQNSDREPPEEDWSTNRDVDRNHGQDTVNHDSIVQNDAEDVSANGDGQSKDSHPNPISQQRPNDDDTKNQSSKSANQPPPPPPPSPLADVIAKDKVLVLPVPEISTAIGKKNDPHLLCNIRDVDDSDCQLDLLGADVILKEDEYFRLDEVEGSSEKPHVWNVVKGLTGGPSKRGTTIGSFKLSSGALTYQWIKPKPADKRLKYALLKIRAGASDEVLCRLAQPKVVEPVKLRTKSSVTTEKIPLTTMDEGAKDPTPFPKTESLRLDVDIRGLPFGRFFSINNEKRTYEGIKLLQALDEIFGKYQVFAPKTIPPRASTQAFILDLSFSPKVKDETCLLSFKTSGSGVEIRAYTTQSATSKGLQIQKNRKWLPKKHERLDSQYVTDYRSDYESQLDDLRQERNTLGNAIQTFEKRQLNVEVGGKDWKAIDEKLRNTRNKKKRIENVYIPECTQVIGWCEDMLDLFGVIDDRLRIHYRLYVEIEGEKVDIVRTNF